MVLSVCLPVFLLKSHLLNVCLSSEQYNQWLIQNRKLSGASCKQNPRLRSRSRSNTQLGSLHFATIILRGCLRAKASIINPRRACAARVTVLGLSVSQSVSQSVCVSVYDYSRTAGNEAASERYQQLQRNKRSKIKMVILLKRRRSRSRNWHYRGPRCVTQPIN